MDSMKRKRKVQVDREYRRLIAEGKPHEIALREAYGKAKH